MPVSVLYVAVSTVYINNHRYIFYENTTTETQRVMCYEMFKTLIHELTHREYLLHNTYFADAMGDNMFRCTGSLDDACFNVVMTSDQLMQYCSTATVSATDHRLKYATMAQLD